MTTLDTLIKDVRLVRPGHPQVERVDIGMTGGKFARIAPNIDTRAAKEILSGHGYLAFPGLVDAHMHTGIYRPLVDDAVSESRAAAMGGVTSSLNYMRTGRHYLDRGGPYREFFPEVLRQSKGRFHVDFGYHLAPIASEHVDEMEMLVREHGVSSFKIFMFYGSHGLHGRSSTQNDFLMIGPEERYDLAHFERIMREMSRIASLGPSLSLHCEVGEILAAYTRKVEQEGKLEGLAAYHASRPPHAEGLAIFIAAYLADEASCLDINLLHLSSRKAIDAAMAMQRLFPHVRFRREVTVGHLLLDVSSPAGVLAKVNPPIRPREDVERLWESVLAGDIDWIVSDHACCAHEEKIDARRPGNVFGAKSGFGGTEYLLSGVFTEGQRRGLPLHRMAELLSSNPARRFGLAAKGDVRVGLDADLVLFDPDRSFVARAADSASGQGFTPFEGMELRGKVVSTYLRGARVFHEGVFDPVARGQYLFRGAAS